MLSIYEIKSKSEPTMDDIKAYIKNASKKEIFTLFAEDVDDCMEFIYSVKDPVSKEDIKVIFSFSDNDYREHGEYDPIWTCRFETNQEGMSYPVSEALCIDSDEIEAFISDSIFHVKPEEFAPVWFTVCNENNYGSTQFEVTDNSITGEMAEQGKALYEACNKDAEKCWWVRADFAVDLSEYNLDKDEE